MTTLTLAPPTDNPPPPPKPAPTTPRPPSGPGRLTHPTYPAPDPIGPPPPPKPGPGAMHRHPSGRTCRGMLLSLPVGLARGVLAELRIRSMAAAVDNVHGSVTA